MRFSFIDRVGGFLSLIRFPNCFFGMIVFLASFFMVSRSFFSALSLVCGICVFLTMAAGNALNDYFDFVLDKHLLRKKPLVAGVFKRGFALDLSILFFIVSIFLSSVNESFFVFNLLAVVMLICYDKNSKKMGFLGNLVIASLTGMVIAVAGFILETLYLPLLLALCAFFVNLSREIAKDVEDMEADRKAGARTLPLQTSPFFSMSFSVVFTAFGLFPYSRLVLLKSTWAALLGFFFFLGVFFYIIVCFFLGAKKYAGRIQKLYKLLMVTTLLTVVP